MNQQEVKDSVGKYVYVDFGKINWNPHAGVIFKIIKLTKAGMVQLKSKEKQFSISVAPSNVYLIY